MCAWIVSRCFRTVVSGWSSKYLRSRNYCSLICGTPQSPAATFFFFLPIFQVLHCCVSGSTLHTQQSRYLLSLSDLSSDYDLMLGQVNSFEPPPSQTTVGEFGNLLTVAEGKNPTRAQKCCQLAPCFSFRHNYPDSECIMPVNTGSSSCYMIVDNL